MPRAERSQVHRYRAHGVCRAPQVGYWTCQQAIGQIDHRLFAAIYSINRYIPDTQKTRDMVIKKVTLLLALAALVSSRTAAQEGLVGAWSTQVEGMEVVLIIAEQHWALTTYAASDGEFNHTEGGAWESRGAGMVSIEREFNTQDTASVGVKETLSVSVVSGDRLRIEGDMYDRIDDGGPGALAGAWLMTGRKRDGVLRERTPGLRKTMKILSGTRFQWIAYHVGTKAFSGTGGGTYTTKDGKYTEEIKFFSRDKTRVGASLPFDFDLVEGKWHHSGKSSKGAPLYEIWSKRPL